MPEKTVCSLVKTITSGDYKKFARLGAVALTEIFAGRIAGAALDGLLDRIWKESRSKSSDLDDKPFGEAEKEEKLVELTRQIIAENLDQLLEKLEQIDKNQSMLDDKVTDIGYSVNSIVDDIKFIRQQYNAFHNKKTKTDKDDKKIALIHMVRTEITIPPFADYAEVLFTIHNFNDAMTKLTDITLHYLKKELINDVALKKAGQVHPPFELSFDLRSKNEGRYNLLENVSDQFTLAPSEAEGFRLELSCDDGYNHHFEMTCRLINLLDNVEVISPPAAFVVQYPISTIETMKSRKQ